MRLLTNIRIIILVLTLLFAAIAIFGIPPNFSDGVMIAQVDRASPAFEAGMLGPAPTEQPIRREIIKEITYQGTSTTIKNIEEYERAIQTIPPGSAFTLRTDRSSYRISLTTLDEEAYRQALLEDENATIEAYLIDLPIDSLGLRVIPIERTNIRRGLELSGGTRVLIALDENVEPDVYDSLVGSVRERLNVFGLSDVIVRPSTDLSGNQYVIVEVTGTAESDLTRLLSEQGQFEARIGDQLAFTGGEDVTYVCRSATCSGIDPQRGCQTFGATTTCAFRFSISLTPQAAQRQADITRDLPIISGADGGYLSENLTLILDGEIVDQLRISAGLRGRAETSISITGSGSGPNRQAAIEDALANEKRLQTLLETGSLPVSLTIVKVDTVSPTLGASFLRNALLVGLFAMLAVIIILILVYKEIKLAAPIAIVSISEVAIILGVASLISWNLDLASIAGIIVAIGTGVDDQIVIADEVLNEGRNKRRRSWKQKIKAAFFIIMGAYFTTLAAMLPLMSAGAGLLRGFALTTIIGVSIGVFITRPAYAVLLEWLVARNKK